MKNMKTTFIFSNLVVVVVVMVMMNMVFTHGAHVHPSSNQSQVEKEALLESGWWSGETDHDSDHCDWSGITCNEEGHVIAVYYRASGELSKLKFSSFPSLRTIDLHDGRLSGRIPHQIGSLTKVIYLDLSRNELSGSIPDQIAALTKLTYLDLSRNELSGSIPPQINTLTSLNYLDLSHNELNGRIPQQIGTLIRLTHLDLYSNELSGSIPDEIDTLTELAYLDLSNNVLNGSIPHQLGALAKLTYFDLSWNELSGDIPSSFGHLSNLISLCLNNNQINGPIPEDIGNLEDLVDLDLSSNSISGKIPSQIQNLKRLENLNLSRNKLSGAIPPSLTYDYKWTSIDLSYNDLEGHIPFELQFESPPGVFEHNKHLCGEIRHRPHCKKGQKITLILVISLLATLCIAFAFLKFLLLPRKMRKMRHMSASAAETRRGDLFSVWDYDGTIAYQDIIQSTENFDIKYCVGVGGYGSVYRAQLPCGKVVALKKLHGWEREEPTYLKSFENEAQILSKIRHRNIVKLHGFCLHRRSMFLVYQFMERGSLFCMLSHEVEALELDWTKRLNVVKSIAHALSYMHHDCSPPIIHRDISSNNVLLNSQLEAFVSDFGTARLLDPDSSIQTLLVGTYGYIAPGKIT